MRIVVCIKQVPGTSKVDIDPVTGSLIRGRAGTKMNPYDLYAIEAAVMLAAKTNGSVTVISMGPPAAATIINEAFMLGAHEGVLLSDIALAGADVLATSYTIAQGIKSLDGFDLIICGKQTTDGDTAQVGPALAEHLGIPHVSWVSKISSPTSGGLTVKQELNDRTETLHISLPALISVETKIGQPRLPSWKRGQEMKDKTPTILNIRMLPDTSPARYGANGSPTSVEHIFEPPARENAVLHKLSAADTVQDIYAHLTEKKFVSTAK